MIQMTGSGRPSIAAVVALGLIAMALAGCGRKGPLEPPPSRATTDAVVTTATTAPTPPAR